MIFKKLRNEFLIINMIAIFIVLCVSFISIFLITYNNVKTEVVQQLNITFEQKNNNNRKENQDLKNELVDDGIGANDELSEKTGGLNDFNPPSISFWALLNSSNEIIELHNSNFNMISEEDCQELLSSISDVSKSFSFFEFNGSYWAYKIIEDGSNYKVAFMNITNNVNVLLNFIYAFLMVSLVVIVVIFVFCYYYANKAIKPIKKSFEKQKRFISDASHELRTPLTVINTNIDYVLSNKDKSVESQDKWLHYIKDESIRMSKLTNDLLSLAKIDSQEVNIVFEKIDISQIIETAVLSMEAVIFENGLNLDYKIEPNIKLRGNTDQIKQLCMILLDNAIKYNQKNGKIIVTLSKKNKEVLFAVKNTGELIEKEHIDKLFDRFYRVDDSRNSETGGYGIGLSIARMIVSQHKGRIEVKSENNKLTCFMIYLPLK